MRRLLLRLLLCLLVVGTAQELLASASVVYLLNKSAKRAGSGDFQWTEVFSVQPDNLTTTRLFSDANLSLNIDQVFVNWQGAASVNSPERVLYATVHLRNVADKESRPWSIYEISLDGSNHVRKLFDFPATDWLRRGTPEIFVSPAGDKIGMYIEGNNAGRTVYIHDSKTGTLLRQLDLDSTVLGKFPVNSMGWLDDNKTLFITLGMPPGEFDSGDRVYKIYGTWVMRDDWTGKKRITPPLGILDKFGYDSYSGDDFYPILLGQFLHGSYVYLNEMVKIPKDRRIPSGAHPFDFLVITGPSPHSNTEMLLNSEHFMLGWVNLSRSTKSIAYTLYPGDHDDQFLHPLQQVTLYARSIKSDQPIRLGTFPRADFLVIGWLEN
jgi:hypothetical protein